MHTPITLIVGLGNPGPQYEANRHNAGVWALEELAKMANQKLQSESKFHGHYARVHLDDYICHLLAPTTFMNRSGIAVQAVAKFYKISPEAILVLHDELDLPVGTVRLKQNGGHGGHNGLRNIMDQLQSKDFYRLRIGVGHPGERHLVHEYVLSNPSISDNKVIRTSISDALVAMPEILAGQMQKAMQKINS